MVDSIKTYYLNDGRKRYSFRIYTGHISLHKPQNAVFALMKKPSKRDKPFKHGSKTELTGIRALIRFIKSILNGNKLKPLRLNPPLF